MSDFCYNVYVNMTDGSVGTPSSLPYEVVFWDCAAPGYEGSRIRVFDGDRNGRPLKELHPAWRSDRRCRFPLEIGLRLQKTCRLHGVTVFSEFRLSPSAMEVYVAGPARQRRGVLACMERDSRVRRARAVKESCTTGLEEYLSSVFVRVGKATFSTSDGEKGDLRNVIASTPKDSAMGMSFKCAFLRLVLWEPEGISSNPGRQVSVTGILVLGSALEGSICPRKPNVPLDGLDHSALVEPTEAVGVQDSINSVLSDLGIDPSLCQGSEIRGQGEEAAKEESGGYVNVAHHSGEGRQERGEAVAPATATALKTVRGLLKPALIEDRFVEAEQLSIALERVRTLGGALSSSRQAQMQAAEREDFDLAVKFCNEAREAETWHRQAVQDASDAGKKRNEQIDDPPRQACEDKPTELTASRAIGTTFDGSTCQANPTADVGVTAPSHGPACDSTQQSIVGTPEDDDTCAVPPWLDPTGQRAIAPWNVLMGIPWPAGVQPACGMVFCHTWKNTYIDDMAGEDRASETKHTRMQTAVMSAVAEATSNLPMGGGNVPDGAPMKLLGTIVRLVAASQTFRRPGPVPPEITPFRLSSGVHEKEPLCVFSSVSRGGARGSISSGEVDGKNDDTSTECKAFACEAADATPCATHVINWIEDNHASVWTNLRRAESAGEQAALAMAAVALAAATTAVKPTRPAPMAPSPEKAVLPHVEGAGGFADYLPLLEATFGIVPVSAACARFPAHMREASIRTCEECLQATKNIAATSCAVSVDAVAVALSSSTDDVYCPLPHLATGRKPAASSSDICSDSPVASPKLVGGIQDQAGALADGAVFRAACLVAAQGLFDSADGPSAAAMSFAVRLVSQWVSPPSIKVAISTREAVAEPIPFDEPSAKAANGQKVDKNKSGRRTPAGDSARSIRLRDLRWGLELLLGCTAADVAGKPEPHPSTGISSDSPGTLPQADHAKQDQFNNHAVLATAQKGLVSEMKPQPASGAIRRAAMVYSLVDIACRQPNVGPALVASILVTWIPHLLSRRPPRSGVVSTSNGVGRQQCGGDTRCPARTPDGFLRNRSPSTGRPEEVSWRCAPAGEEEAKQALAAGAIHMLLFMVQRFPLISLSYFSAEQLALVAESAMAFKTNGKGQVEPAAQCRNRPGGRAVREAGETLMVEIFRAHSGGGMDALLPVLTSASGIIHLQQIASDAPAKNGSGGRQGASDGAGVRGRTGEDHSVAGGAGYYRDLPSLTQQQAVSHVQVRPRLKPRRPRDHMLSTRSPLSGDKLYDVTSTTVERDTLYDMMSTTDESTSTIDERMMSGVCAHHDRDDPGSSALLLRSQTNRGLSEQDRMSTPERSTGRLSKKVVPLVIETADQSSASTFGHDVCIPDLDDSKGKSSAKASAYLQAAAVSLLNSKTSSPSLKAVKAAIPSTDPDGATTDGLAKAEGNDPKRQTALEEESDKSDAAIDADREQDIDIELRQGGTEKRAREALDGHKKKEGWFSRTFSFRKIKRA